MGGREEVEADGKNNWEATFIEELRFSGLCYTAVWVKITSKGSNESWKLPSKSYAYFNRNKNHYAFSLKRIQSQTVKILNSSTYITYKCLL